MNPQYQLYLQSPHWRSLRFRAFKRAGFACECCHSTEKLQGHHLRYRKLYDCTEEDIMCLCERCHMTYHTFEQTGEEDDRDSVICGLWGYEEGMKTLLFLAVTGEECIDMDSLERYKAFCSLLDLIPLHFTEIEECFYQPKLVSLPRD